MLSYFQDKTRLFTFLTPQSWYCIENCIYIASIIVLNIESGQYNIKINLAISCSPSMDTSHVQLASIALPKSSIVQIFRIFIFIQRKVFRILKIL